MTPRIHPPSLALLASEPWRAAGDLWSHFSHRSTASAPRSAQGHAVVLFPGLATDGLSLRPLRRHLNNLGFRALDWGRGFNTGPRGDVDRWLERLKDDVLSLVDSDGVAGERFSLVGWSLGGLYAREIAKLVPHRVRRVVTIGTPFNGTREQTNVAWLFRLLNRHAPADSPPLRARLAAPPPVPTTSVYSRRDGIVAWQACRHRANLGSTVNDIEVSASHLGMGWNRQVMEIVARELATGAGVGAEARTWKP